MAITGCKKFLDKPFDNRLDIRTVDNLQEVVRNGYPTKYDIFTDIMTDSYFIFPSLMQAAWKPLYTPIFLFDDEYEFNLNFASPATSYTHFYNRIYMSNNVIEEIGAVSGDQAQKDVILAEALLVRAYSYFVLTNLFGMHYNETTSSTDLGVPLVLEVNKENRPTYNRATVKELYDQIEADLLKAIQIYEKSPSIVTNNPYQFSVPAAYAFACRYYLYKADYGKTIEYASKTIQLKGLVLRDLNKDLSYQSQFGWPYFTSQMNDPSTHPNIIMASQSNYIHQAVGNNWGGFFIDRTLMSKITENDLRRRYFSNAGTVNDNANWAGKNVYDWNTSRYIMFGMEEVLLNRAEAYMKIQNPNKAAALEDINVFNRTRYRIYTDLSSSLENDKVLDAIMFQRQVEFLAEGLRWYDVKRLGIKVEHKIDVNSDKVDATLMPNDKRTALQIPGNARIGNPNLENQLNPR